MKKFLGAITGTLFFVGLIVLVANTSSPRLKVEFFKARGHVTSNSSNISLKNSSNTTGVVFPEYNITGFYLNTFVQQDNAYPNYTSWPGYYVYVYDFNSSLQNYSNNVYGSVNLSIVAFGNDTAYPCGKRKWDCQQVTVYSNATIYVNGVQLNDTLPDIYVDYGLRVNYTDVQNFLRGYFYAVMVPNITSYYNITTNTTNQTNYLPSYLESSAASYLLKNSSNTTGVVFPEYNISGFYLNTFVQQDNAYPNYTSWPGYYVYVYNFNSSLQNYSNNVYGAVNLSIVAFGNDTAYPCGKRKWNCQQITVYSNATIYVNGVQPNDTLPDIYVDYDLRVNYTDVQNFLRGYFYAVMVPNITSYYNITTNTTNTTSQTIPIPDYLYDVEFNIDCNVLTHYCSGASPPSFITFHRVVGYNFSVTVNEAGTGYFNGMLTVPYTADLVNSTSTYDGKETIVSNLQGNATINLRGTVNVTAAGFYDVDLDKNVYPTVIYDRNNFVRNAVQIRWPQRWSASVWYHAYCFLNPNSRICTL